MSGNSDIYLDYAASSKLSNTAKRLIQENINEDWVWANPSSIYNIGRKAKEKLEEARLLIANSLGCYSDEIYFTSGSSESINWIIKGIVDSYNVSSDKFLVSGMEHPCVYTVSDYLKSLGVYNYDTIKHTKEGFVDLENYKELLNKNNYLLVSSILVQNEIGIVNPIKEMCKLAHQKNILFFSDITAAIGKISINIHDLGIDFACGSMRKFCGIGGVGFCFISRNSKIKPISLIHGSQEKKNGTGRGSTENTFNIWISAKCLEKELLFLQQNIVKVQQLKEYFINQLEYLRLKGINVQLNGSPMLENNDGIGTVNFSVLNTNLNSENLVLMLDSKLPNYKHNVIVSGGSACSSSNSSPSRVLMALPNMIEEIAHKAIRVSFNQDNTEREIDYFISKLCYITESFSGGIN